MTFRTPAVSSVAVLTLALSAAWPSARTAAEQGPPAAPAANQPLAQRIVHTDPAAYRSSPAVHAGAGTMNFGSLLGRGAVAPNINFMHRGEIPVGAGIGHHFHNTADEMFVILNGEAQFTINGRTALVKGPVGVVCKAGSSHAILNTGTEPLQWINFQVSVVAGISDAFDLGDDRVGAALDKIPTFMTFKLDRATLAAGAGRGGRAGAPAAPAAPAGVMSRRAGPPHAFASPWTYLDHMVVNAGASTPETPHQNIGEVYYVLAGSGEVTVGAETAPIRKWDAIPVRIGDTSAFKNTGTEPLEMIVYGVAKDMDAKQAFMLSGGRGGR